MTPMAKMAISICVLAFGIYVSWFVRLGDRTFREHLTRIANTPEVHDLGAGIASTFGAATDVVKTKVAARLHASRLPAASKPDEP